MEVTLVAGLIATLAAAAIPSMLDGLDDLRTAGAARYIAGRMQRLRMEAVMRSTATGIRISQTATGYVYESFADGNANGIRSRDIQSGIDAASAPPERLSNHFAGVDFGAASDVPAVDASSTPPGSDPIRLGSSNIVSFSTMGTASPGSLYIRGSRGAQYVVRIFGETGRTRVLRLNAATGQWQSP